MTHQKWDAREFLLQRFGNGRFDGQSEEALDDALDEALDSLTVEQMEALQDYLDPASTEKWQLIFG